MTISELIKQGYSIQTTYSCTEYKQGDLDLEDINLDTDNPETDASTIGVHNTDTLSTEYDNDSDEYQIFDKDDNCIAEFESYAELIDFIKKMKSITPD